MPTRIIQFLSVRKKSLAQAWSKNGAYSLISWENVTCLWIKHAMCSRQRGNVSAIFILMILVDCKCCCFNWSKQPGQAEARSASRQTDELANRQTTQQIRFNKPDSHSRMTWCSPAESINGYWLRSHWHARFKLQTTRITLCLFFLASGRFIQEFSPRTPHIVCNI